MFFPTYGINIHDFVTIMVQCWANLRSCLRLCMAKTFRRRASKGSDPCRSRCWSCRCSRTSRRSCNCRWISSHRWLESCRSQGRCKVPRCLNRWKQGKELWEIVQYAIKREKRWQTPQFATEAYYEEAIRVESKSIPKQPNKIERRLIISHSFLFGSGAICFLGKSKDNQHRANPVERHAHRSFPTIQVDVGRIIGGTDVLVMVDARTRDCDAFPLKKPTRAVADAVLNFLSTLGYSEKVEVTCDQERVLVAGLELVRATRGKMSLETQLSGGKTLSKARTAIAERTIQTVRN